MGKRAKRLRSRLEQLGKSRQRNLERAEEEKRRLSLDLSRLRQQIPLVKELRAFDVALDSLPRGFGDTFAIRVAFCPRAIREALFMSQPSGSVFDASGQIRYMCQELVYKIERAIMEYIQEHNYGLGGFASRNGSSRPAV